MLSRVGFKAFLSAWVELGPEVGSFGKDMGTKLQQLCILHALLRLGRRLRDIR